MNYLEQHILSALKNGETQSFTALQSKVGFSHSTLQQYLTELIENGPVLKEKDPARGFRRPSYVYHLANAARYVAAALDKPDVELVTLPFIRLKHVCRFEKGGLVQGEEEVLFASNLPPNQKIRPITTLNQ